MKRYTFITEKQVENNLRLKEAFRFIEKSYADFSMGKTITPATTSMPINQGMFYSFPSYIQGRKIFVSKQATDFRNNKKYGLPSVHPYLLVFDSKVGTLKALLEGRYFAAVRTTLSSAVGIKYLSKKPRILAVLGSGVQGKSHAQVLPALFPTITEIRIFSPTRRHREDCVHEMQQKLKKVKVSCASTSREAVKNADVIVCATTSPVPVFNDEDIKDQVLVLGVGAMKNDQEIPLETIGKALVIVDAQKSIPLYDEINIAKEQKYAVNIGGEMGEIINGKKAIIKGRKIVFKHHGLPVTDAALAESILLRMGLLP